MQSALRIGRIGPLNLYLNYTWIFAAILIMWWSALLWLPDNYPGRTTVFYWIVAIVVLLGFFLSVVAHELIHSAIANTGSRTVNLFPFGAAVPFRLGLLKPERVIASALGGVIFNLALGWLLLFVAGMFVSDDGFPSGVRAVFTLLGWLNIALGLVNLIPGIPFDGGWALAGAMYWFTNDHDNGLRIAQFIGSLTTIVLVLVGAWRGLASDAWLQALALVVLAWAAHEAGALGRQRGIMRRMLDQMKVGDFMDEVGPRGGVLATATVADFMAAHGTQLANTPIPVTEQGGELAGVVTVDAAENLLQGTWPTTPVRSLTMPLSNVKTLSPEDSITRALSLLKVDGGKAADADEMRTPVVQDGKMVGSLDPNVLDAFQDAGSEFGVDEAVVGPAAGGAFRFLRVLLPILFFLAGAAILGNIALRTDPDELRDVIPPSAADELILSNFTPEEGAIVPLGELSLSVQAEAGSPVISATIAVDGVPYPANIEGAEAFTKTITSQLPGLTLGLHTARVTVVTENGTRRTESWDFRVLPGAAVGSPTVEVSPTAVAQPTLEPVAQLDFVRYSPVPGGRALAASDDTTLTLDVRSSSEPISATLYLDGRAIEAAVTAVAGREGTYRVSAPVSDLQPGEHRARVEIATAGRGFYSSVWNFTALQPSDANAYFRETGFFVSDPILSFWQDNGGLALYGYPISDEIVERVESTGEVYRAQYFERARLEVHGGSTVAIGRAGALLTPPEPPAQPKEGAQFFAETGHNLGGAFRTYWEQNGGLAIFGFPITEERTERSPTDNKEYVVQYFERARFEYHPENAGSPFEVQLGFLGRQLYNRLYGPR
jgi:Zn-dependent protease